MTEHNGEELPEPTQQEQLLALIHRIEAHADELENTAEHLWDLHEVERTSAGVSHHSVVIHSDGSWMFTRSQALPSGYKAYSESLHGDYYANLAERHTLNAAAYRRKAGALRRLLDEEN